MAQNKFVKDTVFTIVQSRSRSFWSEQEPNLLSGSRFCSYVGTFYSCNSKQVIFTGTLDNLNFNFILICFKNLKVREFNSYD